MFRECYVARMPEWEHRRGLPSKMAAIRAMCTRGHHLIARNFEKVTEYTYTRCTTTSYACFSCRMREWEHGWAQNRAVNGKKRASGFGMAPWRVMMARSHRIKVHICKLTYYIGHGCCPCTFRACFVARMLEWEHAEGCRERSKL